MEWKIKDKKRVQIEFIVNVLLQNFAELKNKKDTSETQPVHKKKSDKQVGNQVFKYL